MKFSILAQTILAIPALATAIPEPVDGTNLVERAKCKLTLQWKSNWYEKGKRRYRVQLITSLRNDEHLKIYCGIMRRYTNQFENQQCYWRDGIYVVDLSEVQGPAGHSAYKHQHDVAASWFREGTGCDVVQNT